MKFSKPMCSIYQMSANDDDNTSITATMRYVSDYLGRMQEITYPDGEVVTYGYDEGGQVNRVSGVRGSYHFDYVDSITYDEYGQRAYIKYSNGAETFYTYDRARRWLSHIKTESRYRTIQNTDYKFDFVGNVLGTTDNCDLWRTTQNYDYDSLYQLISATGTTVYTANGITDYASSTYKQNFSFDSTGNMLTKVSSINNSNTFTTKNRNSLNYSLAYTYNPDFAHRLTNVNGRYYDYDLNGNLTIEQDAPIGSSGDTSVLTPIISQSLGNDVYKEDYGWAISNPDKKTSAVSSSIYQRTFLWDERNLMLQSSDALHTVKYRYGSDGQRTNKYSITSDKGESIYFNKLWTWRKDSYTPSAGNYCKNIFLDKTRIVTKIRAADETSSADAHREYFYHGDHLQSATLITDYEGSVYERINYTPYGELWLEKSDNNGENYLPYRFTGKELDSETGLYYYGARYLDPKYSRWLSTDPALGDYIPQAPISDEAKKHNQNLPGMGGLFNQLNHDLYHYAGNNPVKYTDPDGKLQRDAQGKLQATSLGEFKSKNSNIKIQISVLYTNKGNPIIGVSQEQCFNSDSLGKEFADGIYTLQPNFLTYKNYDDISKIIGAEMSRAGNLETLMEDECSEVSKSNAKSGDLFIRFDNVNGKKTPVFHGRIEKVQKGILGYKYTVERAGKSITYSEKDFSNGYKIYRKNAD